MRNMAIIGDYDSTAPFCALGIEACSVTTSDEAALVLKRLAKEGFAVIYITEELARDISAEIDEYKDSPLPAIIMVPSSKGTLGLGMAGVKKSVERAVGADILFK